MADETDIDEIHTFVVGYDWENSDDDEMELSEAESSDDEADISHISERSKTYLRSKDSGLNTSSAVFTLTSISKEAKVASALGSSSSTSSIMSSLSLGPCVSNIDNIIVTPINGGTCEENRSPVKNSANIPCNFFEFQSRKPISVISKAYQDESMTFEEAAMEIVKEPTNSSPFHENSGLNQTQKASTHFEDKLQNTDNEISLKRYEKNHVSRNVASPTRLANIKDKNTGDVDVCTQSMTKNLIKTATNTPTTIVSPYSVTFPIETSFEVASNSSYLQNSLQLDKRDSILKSTIDSNKKELVVSSYDPQNHFERQCIIKSQIKTAGSEPYQGKTLHDLGYQSHSNSSLCTTTISSSYNNQPICSLFPKQPFTNNINKLSNANKETIFTQMLSKKLKETCHDANGYRKTHEIIPTLDLKIINLTDYPWPAIRETYNKSSIELDRRLSKRDYKVPDKITPCDFALHAKYYSDSDRNSNDPRLVSSTGVYRRDQEHLDKQRINTVVNSHQSISSRVGNTSNMNSKHCPKSNLEDSPSQGFQSIYPPNITAAQCAPTNSTILKPSPLKKSKMQNSLNEAKMSSAQSREKNEKPSGKSKKKKKSKDCSHKKKKKQREAALSSEKRPKECANKNSLSQHPLIHNCMTGIDKKNANTGKQERGLDHNVAAQRHLESKDDVKTLKKDQNIVGKGQVCPRNCKKVNDRNVLDYHLCSECMFDTTASSLIPPGEKKKSSACLKCKKRLNPNDLMCKFCTQNFPNMMAYAGHVYNLVSFHPSFKDCDYFICTRCKQGYPTRFKFHRHLAHSQCTRMCFECDRIFPSHSDVEKHKPECLVRKAKLNFLKCP